MKQKLLFVIDSLDCAGAEKSLVTLLSLLDYQKYQVDLLLFGYGGVLETLLPKEVNLLPPLPYTQFSKKTLSKQLFQLNNQNLNMLRARMKYSLKLRLNKLTNPQKARVFWESASSVIEYNLKMYDIAISYAQGVPTFYVAEKVKAKKKFAWVNVSYRLYGKEKGFQKQYYDSYNKIVAVSDTTREIFLETFPEYQSKMNVIYDINDPRIISEMSVLHYNENIEFEGLKLLTIGRLASQKGYKIALETCRMLKEAGVHFRWYVLGKGPEEDEIKKYIHENDLANHFILLGTRVNPYPIIKNSDIYVQTSKYEGFGLAIAEARMLNIPVVTTRFDAVYNQMTHEKNGLVVDMSSSAVFNGILRLIQDQDLKMEIIEYLKAEPKGNLSELDKFHELIG
ncbi:glycosyltransferase involved in cell wall biosynthesis [Bacillus tianshenii]|uniref:Glycosyltransferase involved in cell wall biosynthesis n=1 Tax=Sutcliffiella tianshenii TaxID=1463404 RepID=A0ABS2NUE9_9BACI|nr:glycosyltransferase [Bacillus tianshenii]MBM7618267.1 glycosyltransferase involved in cell wall biosynthesis [Bacillus tianshenii]